MTKELTLQNIGPIQHFRIPLPETGGVVVLKGEQGVGKSHALEATQNILGGGGKLPVSDGARRATAEGFGVRLEFSNRRSATGDLEVRALEGFPLDSFVNPGYTDPVANDTRRVKALLGLCGVTADASLFEPIVAGLGKFDELISKETLAQQDIVQMAAGVRKDLQSKARAIESQAEMLASEVANRRASLTEMVDPKISAAEAKDTQRICTLDVGRFGRVLEETKETVAKWDAAKRVVDSSEIPDAGTRLATLAGNIELATFNVGECEREVAELTEKLEKAKERLRAATAIRADFVDQNAKLQSALSAVSVAVEAIKEPRPDVSEADKNYQSACERLNEANDLVNRATQWEIRTRVASEIEKLSAEKAARDRAAQALRDAASRTDDVLSDTICRLLDQMKVEQGRLLYNYPKRGKYIPFDELSQGEAYTVAIDIAASVLGVGGVFVLNQAAWGELNDRSRDLVAERCREKGCVMITAQATEDPELTVSFYEPRANLNESENAGGFAADAGSAGGGVVSGVPAACGEGSGLEGDPQGPPDDVV